MDQSDQNHFTTLLKSFSQISSPRSKRLALEGFMRSLSHQEIRDVQGYVNDIRYTTDIFAKLPLELSQRIAQYLGLPQATRTRRVSKRWLDILTSSSTTQSLLRPWHGTGDSTIRIPDGLSPNAISSLKAEHVSAYRSGIAFDQQVVRGSISRKGPLSNNVAYSNGKVAWIDNDKLTARVLSVEGEGILRTSMRGEIALSHLALSSSILAVTTFTGECRITDLEKEMAYQFQLSPTSIKKIVAAQETLGVLHRPLTSGNMQVCVTTWTLSDRTPFSFTARLHRSVVQKVRPCDLKIMLDKSERFVIVFERVTEANAVYFTRYSLEGRVQAQGNLALPNTERFARHSEKDMPINANRWATVWSYSTSKRNQDEMWTYEVLRVQYELDRDILRLKDDSFEAHLRQELIIFDIFFWNDIAYCHAMDPFQTISLEIIDFSESFNEPAVMGCQTSTVFESGPELREFVSDGGHTKSLLLGDDRFLVNACRLGLIIWAFDKNRGMTVTDTEFRLHREEARKEKWGPWARSWPGKD